MFFATGKLRVLALAPLLFLYMVIFHYLGSLDYCQTCILPYTASFAGLGAVCAGIAVSLIMHLSRKELLPGPIMAVVFTGMVITLSQTATGFATRSEYRFYPSAMLANPRPISEQEETRALAAFLKDHIKTDKPLLPIYDLVTVPYAAFLADRSFPTQGINLRHSYRQLRPDLNEQEKRDVLYAAEREGLWTDEILERWIAGGFDTIVFQVDPRNRESNLQQSIAKFFERKASTGFRGWNIHVYERICYNADHGDSTRVTVSSWSLPSVGVPIRKSSPYRRNWETYP